MTGIVLFVILFSGVFITMYTGGYIDIPTIIEILTFGGIIAFSWNFRKSYGFVYGLFFMASLCARYSLIEYLQGVIVCDGCIGRVVSAETISVIVDIAQVAIYMLWFFLFEGTVGFIFAGKCNKVNSLQELDIFSKLDHNYTTCSGTVVCVILAIVTRMTKSYSEPFRINFILFILIVVLVHLYMKWAMHNCIHKRELEIVKGCANKTIGGVISHFKANNVSNDDVKEKEDIEEATDVLIEDVDTDANIAQ